MSAIAALLLLSACGSGSGSGSEPSNQAVGEPSGAQNGQVTGDSNAAIDQLVVDENINAPEDFEPFNDLTLKAAANYKGVAEEAVLEANSAADFLHTLLFGAFSMGSDVTAEQTNTSGFMLGAFGDSLTNVYRNLFASISLDSELFSALWNGVQHDYDPITPGEGYTCMWGGTFDVTKTQPEASDNTQTRYTYTYHNCETGFTSDRSTLNGSVSIHTTVYNRKTASLFIGYNELNVTTGNRSFVLTGAEKWPRIATCGLQGARTSYVLVKDQLDSAVLYENFKTSVIGSLKYYKICGATFRAANWFEGRLLHSDEGAVSVTTPHHLQYTRNSNGAYEEVDQPATDNGRVFGGKLVLSGAQNSELTFSYDAVKIPENYVEKFRFDFNDHPSVVVSLSTEENAEDISIKVPSEAMDRGVLIDLGDSDADGIIDGWERTYGLDPNNSADAAQDTDEDGFSALAEFEQQSNPDDSTDTGQNVDGYLQIIPGNTRFDYSTQSLTQTIDIHGYLNNEKLFPASMKYTVRIVGDAYWPEYKFPYDCKKDASDAKLLRCTVWNPGASSRFDPAFTSGTFTFSAPGNTDVTIIAELANSELDRNTDNNKVEFSSTMRAPEPDYSIDVNGDIVGNEVEVHTVIATIKQSVNTHGTDVAAFVSIPAGVQIIRADFLSDGPQAITSRCTINGDVHCTMNNVKNDHTLTLKLEYSVLSEVEDDISWQLVTSQPESDLSNNSATTSVRYALPMAQLQALIDSAASGDVIQFPAGEYVGTLDGRGKTLEVRGAAESKPTVLISPSIDSYALINVGVNSLYRQLTFRVGGSAVLFTNGQNLTIADSSFIPPLRGKHQTAGLVVGNNTYRLINNQISGFGIGDGNYCHQLIKLDGFSRTFVQRNVFTNNDCLGVIGINYRNNYSGTSSEHLVGNNTFVDNKQLIYISGYKIKAKIRVENNIVVNTDTLINTGRRHAEFHSQGGLTTSRNLIYISEREALLTGQLLAHTGYSYDLTDLSFDPVFEDKTAGDFRLSSSSPAIDQGGDAQPFVYTTTYTTQLKMPYDAEVMAIDGMQDGNAVFDPGAFEFAP